MATYTEPTTQSEGKTLLAEAYNREIVDSIRWLWANIPTATPAGMIVDYAGVSAPAGWLLCYGQAISRTTYATLYAAIGTTYGAGDGSTTFNLPDLRGRMPLGKDNMGGTSANRVTASQADNLGQGSGIEAHQLTIAQMPPHSHSINPGYGAQSNINGNSGDSNANVQTTNSGSAGSNQSHNNMPPYRTQNFIIKV